MRVATSLTAAVLAASLQMPQTPGPVPPEQVPPLMSPFVQTCAACHGERGEGKAAAGFPRIAGQSQHYILKQLDDYAAGRRSDPVMEPIAKGLPPEARVEVAGYFARMDAPPGHGGSAFTQSWMERGERLATRGDMGGRVQACANCHGPAGVGQPPTLPYLAGLDAGYIRVTLHAWRDGRRRNDTGQQMASIAKALQPDDIAAVARYYAALTPPGPAPANVVLASTPRLIDPAATASTTVGSDTKQGTGTGAESGAPAAGGEHGLSAGGARSSGAGDRAAGGSGAGGAPVRAAQIPALGAPSVEDAARGRAILASGAHGCAACHTIPGIRAPRGIVGPNLTGFARRPFIAGQLPNTPDVLIAFLQDPPAFVPKTGMPDLRLTADEARWIAAYLYTMEPPDTR